MYFLPHDKQFQIIGTSNTEDGDFERSVYPSIYIAVLLAVHVFYCDVMGVPCKGAVCECDHYLTFIFYCANEYK